MRLLLRGQRPDVTGASPALVVRRNEVWFERRRRYRASAEYPQEITRCRLSDLFLSESFLHIRALLIWDTHGEERKQRLGSINLT